MLLSKIQKASKMWPLAAVLKAKNCINQHNTGILFYTLAFRNIIPFFVIMETSSSSDARRDEIKKYRGFIVSNILFQR